MKHFEVTKKFTSGLLAGLIIKEITAVPFIEGKVYKSYTNSEYEIINIKSFGNFNYGTICTTVTKP